MGEPHVTQSALSNGTAQHRQQPGHWTLALCLFLGMYKNISKFVDVRLNLRRQPHYAIIAESRY